MINLSINYLTFVKSQPVAAYIVEEIKRKQDLNWQFFEPCHISCSGYVFTNNVTSLLDEDLKDFILLNKKSPNLNVADCQEYLNHIDIKNVNIYIDSND